MRNKEVAVIDLIQEEPGSGITVDQILEAMPKSKNKAQEFILQLTEHLKNELLELNALDTKRKKVLLQIKQTEPMKALAKLKKEIKLKKKDSARMADVLYGARKMAKAMGIDVSGIKSLNPGG
jgi:hypothetical protein